MDATAIGQTLRWARRRAGMTQQGLAEVADVPQATVARIERGTVIPRAATLVSLLAATGHRLRVEPDAGIEVDRAAITRRMRMSLPRRTREALGRPAREPRTGPFGILRRLRTFGVPFVLIGELAEVAHGAPASIPPLVEVCHESSDRARERLAKALADLEKDMGAARLHRRLRLVAETSSGDGYELLARNAVSMHVDSGMTVRVAAIEDLIRIRRARAAPADRAAAEALEAIVRELTEPVRR